MHIQTPERYRINCIILRENSQFVSDKVQLLEINHEENFDTRVEVHNKQVLELKDTLESSRDKYDTLCGRMNDLESARFETKKHIVKYLDSTRQLMLSLNVGILNVEPIIWSVLKHIAGC